MLLHRTVCCYIVHSDALSYRSCYYIVPYAAILYTVMVLYRTWYNLVHRVLWLFGQRMGASRDSGVLEFCYRNISAVKQWKSLQGSQSKNLNFFEFPRVSTGAHPLTKKPEDSGYEIVPGKCQTGQRLPLKIGAKWTSRDFRPFPEASEKQTTTQKE